jgi:hypothetical protein
VSFTAFGVCRSPVLAIFHYAVDSRGDLRSNQEESHIKGMHEYSYAINTQSCSIASVAQLPVALHYTFFRSRISRTQSVLSFLVKSGKDYIQ